MLAHGSASTNWPKCLPTAAWLNVPAGPRYATRKRCSSARHADITWRKMPMTAASDSGPPFPSHSRASTCASRSGRYAGAPLPTFSSPIAFACMARSLSRARISRSSTSIASRCTARRASASSSFGAAGASLAMRPLEVAHPGNERVDARARHRVVDRRTHAAHRAVTLELRQPALFRAVEERVVQRLVAQHERHTDARAVFLAHRIAVEAGAVDLRIQRFGLRDVDALDRRKPALR